MIAACVWTKRYHAAVFDKKFKHNKHPPSQINLELHC